VYYTAGINVASNEVQGQIPTAQNLYSFERIELSTNRLTRQGYTHIGWVDVSTGTQYLFNGTTTQSLDDESGIAVLTDIQATSEWISSPQGIVENRVATQADMKFVVPWDGTTLAALWKEEALEANDITITTEKAAENPSNWLFELTGARVYDPLTGTTLRYPTVTENTVQTTPGVYSVTFSSGDSGLTKTISVTVKAVATTTIDQFGTNPFGQTILFVATKPGESVQSALKSAGVTLGVDVQGTGKNFVIIGPNNSGFLISGATGVGYILPNKEGTGYTLPGAGSNFTIIGNHEAGYQLIDPNGQVYDVIGDIDQGYYLLSQDKKLYILRGNSITGFYLVLLSDIDTENDAEDATKQSPLTTGRTRSVYPFGVAGGLLLSLYCVMQWNPPRKKKRV
jgi:hypothetical protein